MESNFLFHIMGSAFSTLITIFHFTHHLQILSSACGVLLIVISGVLDMLPFRDDSLSNFTHRWWELIGLWFREIGTDFPTWQHLYDFICLKNSEVVVEHWWCWWVPLMFSLWTASRYVLRFYYYIWSRISVSLSPLAYNRTNFPLFFLFCHHHSWSST